MLYTGSKLSFPFNNNWKQSDYHTAPLRSVKVSRACAENTERYGAF